ncbi:hypothetical protein [Clostridium chrysemydis]|uniref:hypothetical protein n=1 Tax=Clostridium chrysemydis TaxID=2665504 RepID=UPI001883779E|nr:hypothetical protein [Clostridium chrysemydis]
MRESYNTFDYWSEMVDKNKTIRGHMFMNTLPNEKSIYMHSLCFSNNNGIENVYAYFPSVKALLGYIQYSFLQEFFYKWIYGTEKVFTDVPFDTVSNTIADGLSKKKITKEEADEMLKEYNEVRALWDSQDSDIVRGLVKFSRKFNKFWLGDSTKFLYLKVYKTTDELCDFIEDALKINTDIEEKFGGLTVEEWKEVCLKAPRDRIKAGELREIFLKKLSETM